MNSEAQITTVLLVDDHPMVQSGLSSCLSFYEDIQIVGAISDGALALDTAIETQPDVILMDISMPKLNGIDASEVILEKLPETRILIFSMHENAEFVTSAMQAGAYGYILKNTSSEEVYKAIKAVAVGEKYYSSSIAQLLLESPPKPDNEKLTTREQVILSYIANGKSSKEIARILNISFRTIESHRRNIKFKLGIESLAEMVRYAVEHGLVEKQ
jgi:two-component system NarL family response regulator